MRTLTATFADGDVKHRNIQNKTYSHAWRVRYSYATEGERLVATQYGFANTAFDAHKESRRARKEGGPSCILILDRQVVVVTEKKEPTA